MTAPPGSAIGEEGPDGVTRIGIGLEAVVNADDRLAVGDLPLLRTIVMPCCVVFDDSQPPLACVVLAFVTLAMWLSPEFVNNLVAVLNVLGHPELRPGGRSEFGI